MKRNLWSYTVQFDFSFGTRSQ